MNFTDAQKKTITRRQLNILLENSTHDRTLASIVGQQSLLLEVDNANAVYYDYYDLQAKSYEGEYRALAGTVASNYLASDITAAAIDPTQPPFFPTTPMYLNLIPKVISTQKGLFSPTSTDTLREDNVINQLTQTTGVIRSLNFAQGTGVYGTGEPVTAFSGGPGIVVFESPTELTWMPTIGDFVISKGSGSSNCIAKITGTTGFAPFRYFCDIINGTFPGAITLFPYDGFTQSQRQLGLTGFNTAITNLRTNITNQMNLHKTYMQASINNLTTQNDTRATQVSQKTAALTSANNTVAAENAWIALSVNNAMGTIETILPIILTRQTFINTRKAQIITALGQSDATAIIQNGEAFTTTYPENSYFQRYKWLNARINRASGSLRRYYSSNDSAQAIINLKNQNLLLLSEYNQSFNTKVIVQLNQTTLLNLNDNVGLNVNDEVSITSDTQPIIKRVIVEVIGTTEVRLNYPIPAPYVLQEKVRLFKEL